MYRSGVTPEPSSCACGVRCWRSTVVCTRVEANAARRIKDAHRIHGVDGRAVVLLKESPRVPDHCWAHPKRDIAIKRTVRACGGGGLER
eukprot:2188093-Pyramimonas_sp.AAC.1